MRVTIDRIPIGTGSQLFHCTVYAAVDWPDQSDHGTMHLVAADSLARALYTAWLQAYDDTEPFDLERCDGYLIGHIERHL